MNITVCPAAASETVNDERDFWSRLIAGEAAAWRSFVEGEYESLIWSVLRKLRVAEQDREDYFHDIFLHLREDNCRRLRLWCGRGSFKS